MIKTKTITLSIHQLQFIQKSLQLSQPLFDERDEDLDEESTSKLLMDMVEMTLENEEEDIIHNFTL